jgi:hypothetical protein
MRAGHRIRKSLSAGRDRLVSSKAVFPRIQCPVCARLIAVNANGQLRTHFCPHRDLCEPQRCLACQLEQLSAATRSESGADCVMAAGPASLRG